MATLTREGLDLRYEVAGSGPALLLPEFNLRWDQLDVGLPTERFTVIIASPRGFAASGRLPQMTTTGSPIWPATWLL